MRAIFLTPPRFAFTARGDHDRPAERMRPARYAPHFESAVEEPHRRSDAVALDGTLALREREGCARRVKITTAGMARA